MSSVNYIQDGTGNTFIPATQRPDGTWRRPIRVRDGYVPQDEQPLYVSKGKQEPKSSAYPVGLSAADFVPSSRSNTKSSSLYFEIGNYEPVTKIPGLNFVPEPEEEKKAKKKKKNKAKGQEGEVTAPKASNFPPSQSKSTAPPSTSTTDPLKRLRYLRKKLKDIEALELKISSGELQNPEKEQVEKIERKDEVLDEMEELNAQIESMNL